jgi:hypothetical protein
MVNICRHYKTLPTHLQKKSQVTLPSSHDTVAIGQKLLTRSIGVICLSQYLQHLLWTRDILHLHFNHPKPFIIVTRSLSQPHTTLQILRHTSLLPGQFPANKRDSRPVSCAGNANSLNCRAVRFHARADRHLSHLSNLS